MEFGTEWENRNKPWILRRGYGCLQYYIGQKYQENICFVQVFFWLNDKTAEATAFLQESLLYSRFFS